MYPNKLSRSFPSPNANRFALTTPHVPRVDVKQRPRSEFTTFTRAHLKPTPFGRLLEKNEQRTDNTCRSQKTEPNDNRNSNSDSNRALIVVTFFAAFHVPPPVSLYALCYTNQPTAATDNRVGTAHCPTFKTCSSSFLVPTTHTAEYLLYYSLQAKCQIHRFWSHAASRVE